MKESAKSHVTFVTVAGIIRPVMNLLMGKKWEGLEKLPAGGFIAAPNHCTEIDPLVVGHMLYNQKRMPHFLAKAGLFKVPVLGAVLRSTKQIPVERSTTGANRSLQLAKEIVNDGCVTGAAGVLQQQRVEQLCLFRWREAERAPDAQANEAAAGGMAARMSFSEIERMRQALEDAGKPQPIRRLLAERQGVGGSG